jgi:uncharacterized protein
MRRRMKNEYKKKRCPTFVFRPSSLGAFSSFCRHLIVFARQPIPGRTKTRLCPPLDGATAAALYECFLRDVLVTARNVPNARVVIAYTPESDPAYFAQLAPDLHAFPQHGTTLGERMANAFASWRLEIGDDLSAVEAYRAADQRGMELSAILIGSDFPTLPASYLASAFTLLERGADLAFGPSDDGGYYLVGMRDVQRQVLCEVPMSTPTVLADSLALAAQLGLHVELAPPHYDIDDATDLVRLVAELREAPPDVAVHTRAFLREGYASD